MAWVVVELEVMKPDGVETGPSFAGDPDRVGQCVGAAVAAWLREEPASEQELRVTVTQEGRP